MTVRRANNWIVAALSMVALTACSGDGRPGAYDYEQLVKRSLKDPDSARFKDEQIYKMDSGTYIMCGSINAKNSFGGYTGYRRFIAGGTIAMIEGDELDAMFPNAWENICIRHTVTAGNTVPLT